MQKLYVGLFILIVISLCVNAFAQSCNETRVLSPSPMIGNHGEIMKLADGSLWEVYTSFEYIYEYYPTVMICSKDGKLLVIDETITVRHISSGTSKGRGKQSVIESIIVSEFQGLNAGNVYKLANGQIWG